MPASREQIADTFERHVNRFGYAKATVEDTAAELGISKKTIYEHFSSKRDLYLYIVERMARTWRGEMRSAIKDLPTSGERAEALMGIVFAGARQHIAETTESEWQQEYEIVGEALMKAIGEVMDEVIESGIATGEFAVGNAAVAKRLFGAIALEYTLIVREDPRTDADAAVARAMRRFLG
ncbi:MAG: TetR/AcrR family transcriptional regulator [Coriobacteriia bacterium]|nr:TetR/AcrR family transcriptional regulator [Coriobacteriia bacterium]MBN2839395.1 TetR/AcrR family transcriptional regulator [Coriobacteriia bacterium]